MISYSTKMDARTQLHKLLEENEHLREENDKLKNALYVPKIVNNVFDCFMWVNKSIADTISSFDTDKHGYNVRVNKKRFYD